MEILSYSERGVINSLFYELYYSENNLQLFNTLISLFSFPYRGISFQISDARIMIEQSFSDFGDADTVLLLNNQGKKQVMFIEAKIKTFSLKNWSIEKEFNKFKEGIKKKKVGSSNLFTQLYHKYRLIKALQNGEKSVLQKGISFPECSTKKIRKIGNNGIVLEVVKIIAKFCNDAFFVGLVPDNLKKVADFFDKTLKNYYPHNFADWDIKNWGYITWPEIEDFCNKFKLKRTINTFAWNRGQIY